MNLKQFLKQPKTMQFIRTDGGYYKTYNDVNNDIRNKVEEYLAARIDEEETRDAIDRMLNFIEPIDSKLDSKVNTLLKKWGFTIE